MTDNPAPIATIRCMQARAVSVKYARLLVILTIVAGCAKAGDGAGPHPPTGAVSTTSATHDEPNLAGSATASTTTSSAANMSDNTGAAGTSTTTSSAATRSTMLPSVVASTLEEAVADQVAKVAAAEQLGPLPGGTKYWTARRAAALYGNGCHLSWGAVEPRPCAFGDLDSETVIVITGDSHAAHWFGGFEEAAVAHGWKLVTVTKAGCPAADVPVYSAREDLVAKGVPYTACAAWRPRAQRFIRSLDPDLVVFPMLTRRGVSGSPGKEALPAWSKGLSRSIEAVRGEDTAVLILGDTPKTNGKDVPGCVASHRDDIRACGNARSKAVFTDRLRMLEETAATHDASYLDVSDWFCGPQRCPAVIDGQVVYRDNHHLSDGFSRSLATLIAAVVEDALAAR